MSDAAGAPTVACPTCNGPLTADGKAWVCEVGHSSTFPELAQEQAEAVVRSLWYALRALEDRAISSRFAIGSMEENALDHQAERLRSQSEEDLVMVDQLHDLLQKLEGVARRAPAEHAPVSHAEPSGQGSHNEGSEEGSDPLPSGGSHS